MNCNSNKNTYPFVSTGSYRFWCEDCKKGFNFVHHYNDHMAKHEGTTTEILWKKKCKVNTLYENSLCMQFKELIAKKNIYRNN